MGKIAQLINVLPRRDFHDLSQSIYGTMTWGLLYPVYSRYFNAGDIVRIKPNFLIRTAPTIAPLFGPVEVRLHRFWCPVRLYHNAMRENSRSFDYTTISRHVSDSFQRSSVDGAVLNPSVGTLFDWLNLVPSVVRVQGTGSVSLRVLTNFEPVVAYWDIVRNFYGFSKNNIFSYVSGYDNSTFGTVTQRAGTLDKLDEWVEGIYNSKKPLLIGGAREVSGYASYPYWLGYLSDTFSSDQHNLEGLAVAPSNPDGLSRFVPNLSTDTITVNAPFTIPSLAVASKVQSVRDILSAAGTRFTDYLYGFFKTSIPHSDVPSLLYSGRFWLNSSPIFQNSGGESDGIGGGRLGSFVGQNMASAGLSSRRYKFDEPGYLMDILSIRPVYAWSGAIPYPYLDVSGFSWFNPRLNSLGFRSLVEREYGYINTAISSETTSEPLLSAKTPFWNEFRSSVDVVHGNMRFRPGASVQSVESFFIPQRNPSGFVASGSAFGGLAEVMFCSMSNINNQFVSTSLDIDNTYMSSYYNVTVSSYVSKRFATDLTSC